MPNFKLFKKAPGGTLALSVSKRGVIRLNVALFAKLGKPEAVHLLYDDAEHLVALRPAEQDSPDAFSFRGGKPSICCTAFCRERGIPAGGTSAIYQARITGDGAVFSFTGETSPAATGVPAAAEPEDAPPGRDAAAGEPDWVAAGDGRTLDYARHDRWHTMNGTTRPGCYDCENPGPRPLSASRVAVLRDIRDHPGSAPAKIAGRTGMTAANASQHCRRLVKDGFLVKGGRFGHYSLSPTQPDSSASPPPPPPAAAPPGAGAPSTPGRRGHPASQRTREAARQNMRKLNHQRRHTDQDSIDPDCPFCDAMTAPATPGVPAEPARAAAPQPPDRPSPRPPATTEGRKKGGQRGGHNRHHRDKQVYKPDCALCQEEGRPEGVRVDIPDPITGETRATILDCLEHQPGLNEAGIARVTGLPLKVAGDACPVMAADGQLQRIPGSGRAGGRDGYRLPPPSLVRKPLQPSHRRVFEDIRAHPGASQRQTAARLRGMPYGTVGSSYTILARGGHIIRYGETRGSGWRAAGTPMPTTARFSDPEPAQPAPPAASSPRLLSPFVPPAGGANGNGNGGNGNGGHTNGNGNHGGEYWPPAGMASRSTRRMWAKRQNRWEIKNQGSLPRVAEDAYTAAFPPVNTPAR